MARDYPIKSLGRKYPRYYKSEVDLYKYHLPARVAREALELVNGPSHVDPPLLQAAHLVPPVIGKMVNVDSLQRNKQYECR